MMPSKIENWTIIVDLNNVGLTQIPKNLLQSVITSMQRNYRGRLFRMFAVNVHWLVRGLWQIAKNLVDEFTLTKMNMLGYEFKDNILQVIDAGNLEAKYGGSLPNKEIEFFPPELI